MGGGGGHIRILYLIRPELIINTRAFVCVFKRFNKTGRYQPGQRATDATLK